MPKKSTETTIKKQAEKKAVDEAMIKAVLSRVAEIGVRKAAEEAGVAWQTVSKWKKDAEKELTTPEDIIEDVEGLADIMNPPAATAVEEPSTVEEKPIVEEKAAETAAAEEKATQAVEEAPSVKDEKVEEEKVEEAKIELIIESTMGGQVSAEEIIKRVKEKRSDAAKSYVKPEENKAYFTYGDSVGAIELW